MCALRRLASVLFRHDYHVTERLSTEYAGRSGYGGRRRGVTRVPHHSAPSAVEGLGL